MSLLLAHRDISLLRSKAVAFGAKPTSTGKRNPQLRSKMTLAV
jgi:hypothetical protein